MSGIGRKLVAALPEEHTWVGGAVRATLRTQSHNARDPMAAPGDLRRSLQSQVTIPVRRAGSTAAPAALAALAEPAPAAEHPVMRRSASEPWRRTSSNNGRRSDAGQPPAEVQADTSVIQEQHKELGAAVDTAAADTDVLATSNVSSATVAAVSVRDATAAGSGSAAEPAQTGAEEDDSGSNAGKVTAVKQGKHANRKKGNQQDKRSSVTAQAAISPFVSPDNGSSGAGTSAAEVASAAADAAPLASPAAATADSNTLNGKSSPWGRASSMPPTTKVEGPVAAAVPGTSSATHTAASMPLKATAQNVASARISNGGSAAAPPAGTHAHSRSSSSVGAGLASALAARTSPPTTPGGSSSVGAGLASALATRTSPPTTPGGSSGVGAGLASALAARTSPPTTPGGSSGGLQAYDRYSELLFRLQQFLPALKAKAAQNADFEATWEVLKAELGALVAAAKFAAQQAARLEALDQEVEKLQRLLGLIGREVKSNVLQQQLKEIFKESPLQPLQSEQPTDAKASKEPRAAVKPAGPSTTFGNYPDTMSRTTDPGRVQRAAPAPAKVITVAAAAKLDHMYRSINRAETSPQRLGYKVLAVKTPVPHPVMERRGSSSSPTATASSPAARRSSGTGSSPTAVAAGSSPRRSYSAVLPGPTLAELASFSAARETFLSATSPKGPRTDRWLQSLVPKSVNANANSAAAVDKAMGQLKKVLKDNGVPLELTRLAPFTYEAAGKRMNIKQQATGLVVRKGGGYEDLLTVLGRLPAPGLTTGASMNKTDMAALLRVASDGSSGMLMGTAHESFSVFSTAAAQVVVAA